VPPSADCSFPSQKIFQTQVDDYLANFRNFGLRVKYGACTAFDGQLIRFLCLFSGERRESA